MLELEPESVGSRSQIWSRHGSRTRPEPEPGREPEPEPDLGPESGPETGRDGTGVGVGVGVRAEVRGQSLGRPESEVSCQGRPQSVRTDQIAGNLWRSGPVDG